MTIITIFNSHHMTLNWDDNQQFVNDCTVLHHVLDIGSQQIFCPPRNNLPFNTSMTFDKSISDWEKELLLFAYILVVQLRL